MDYVESVERQLDLPSNDKKQVTRELRAHFDELREELIASGMGEAQTAQEAARRLGDPALVAAQITNVHSRMSWGSAFLAAAPLVIAALIGRPLSTQYRPSLDAVWFVMLVAFATVTTAGCVREFIRDRRPIWVATWLAGALRSLYWINTEVFRHSEFAHGSTGLFVQLAPLLPMAAIMLGVALWASWRVPKLRLAAILGELCVLSFFASQYHIQHGSTMSVPSIALLIMGAIATEVVWIVIAVGIFALHKHSNAYVAALFLFAHRLIMPSGGSALQSPLFAAYILVGILAVVFFARCRNWRLKVTGLCLAIAVPIMEFAWVLGRTPESRLGAGLSDVAFLTNTAFSAIPTIVLLLLVPLLFERTQKMDRLEVVR